MSDNQPLKAVDSFIALTLGYLYPLLNFQLGLIGGLFQGLFKGLLPLKFWRAFKFFPSFFKFNSIPFFFKP